MVPTLAFLCLFFGSIPGYPSPNSQRAEQLVLSADKVIIRGELDKAPVGIVVTDRAWIERVAKTLARIPLVKANQCLCIGWTTAYFYKGGNEVFSVAPIHGNQLRIYSARGGGDFAVAEKSWNAIADLLVEKTKANHPPEATPEQRPGVAPGSSSSAPQR